MGWSLANWLFFKKVRKALGLDRCHFPITGAAPITSDVLDYFMSINIPIHEMYGMSETTGSYGNQCGYLIIPLPSSPGPTTVTTAENIRYRSSGRVIDGAEVMIKDPDGEGVGEVCEATLCVTIHAKIQHTSIYPTPMHISSATEGDPYVEFTPTACHCSPMFKSKVAIHSTLGYVPISIGALGNHSACVIRSCL